MGHNKRVFWRTRFGFYMAAIGSAVGLGNLWRFPYVVGDNGGGAFVLLYVLMALLLGLPLLIGELILGKSTRQNVLRATSSLGMGKTNTHFHWVGRLAVLTSLIVLGYYAVVSGWVLHFLTQFTVGLFSEQALLGQGRFDILISNGWLQMGLASAHVLIVVVIVLKGFQDGFEKWISSMMPMFFLLLLLLMFKSLSLPTAVDALRFLLYPDFSKLNGASMLQAIGHVCFTLSIGFGSMVTFGSYLRENDFIPTAGVRVALVDTSLSLLAGTLIFPVVLMASGIRWSDPGLLFEALPQFFVQIPGGILFGWAFFLCLYLSALAVSIGLLEVVAANWKDELKISRHASIWSTGGLTLLIGLMPALSSSLFSKVRFAGKSLLEILDFTLVNLVLPLIALGVCFTISKGIKRADKEKYFIDLDKIESVALFPYWLFALRWLIPGLILLALVTYIISLVI